MKRKNFFEKLQEANNKQKLILTVWIVVSIFLGRYWALSDYDEMQMIFYIPIALLLLSIPTVFLYKLWAVHDSASDSKTEDSKYHGQNISNEKKNSWFFWWRLDGEKLQNQIEQYDSLKNIQSWRGASASLLLFSSALTVILFFLGVLEADVLYGLIIYLPLALLIYKGNEWAMLAGMILWTGEKLYSLFSGAGFPAIVWWIILMGPLYGAYRVERLRSNKQ